MVRIFYDERIEQFMQHKNFKDFYSLFSMDEMILLNHMGMDMSKNECLVQIKLSMDICTDESMLMDLQEFLDKIKLISDDEWKLLQKYLPFKVSIQEDEDDFEDVESLYNTYV